MLFHLLEGQVFRQFMIDMAKDEHAITEKRYNMVIKTYSLLIEAVLKII